MFLRNSGVLAWAVFRFFYRMLIVFNLHFKYIYIHSPPKDLSRGTLVVENHWFKNDFLLVLHDLQLHMH